MSQQRRCRALREIGAQLRCQTLLPWGGAAMTARFEIARSGLAPCLRSPPAQVSPPRRWQLVYIVEPPPLFGGGGIGSGTIIIPSATSQSASACQSPWSWRRQSPGLLFPSLRSYSGSRQGWTASSRTQNGRGRWATHLAALGNFWRPIEGVPRLFGSGVNIPQGPVLSLSGNLTSLGKLSIFF